MRPKRWLEDYLRSFRRASIFMYLVSVCLLTTKPDLLTSIKS